jgi:hypothetical protein
MASIAAQRSGQSPPSVIVRTWPAISSAGMRPVRRAAMERSSSSVSSIVCGAALSRGSTASGCVIAELIPLSLTMAVLVSTAPSLADLRVSADGERADRSIVNAKIGAS